MKGKVSVAQNMYIYLQKCTRCLSRGLPSANDGVLVVGINSSFPLEGIGETLLDHSWCSVSPRSPCWNSSCHGDFQMSKKGVPSQDIPLTNVPLSLGVPSHWTTRRSFSARLPLDRWIEAPPGKVVVGTCSLRASLVLPGFPEQTSSVHLSYC